MRFDDVKAYIGLEVKVIMFTSNKKYCGVLNIKDEKTIIIDNQLVEIRFIEKIILLKN